ncbi:MAG: cation transporter [Prevotella sp.]|nr:cation transporter [Prevotella sp.]
MSEHQDHHNHQDHHDHHGHHHGHHHHHSAALLSSQSGLFVFCIVLNVLFVVVEAAVGLLQNSLSLLSDAGHNLSDVFSLLLVLIAFRLAKVHPGKHYTYGLRKSTVLISLVNAILLLIAVGGILIESCHKFYEPAEVNGIAVSWTAGVGIVINGLTAVLLMRGQKNDINVRGAYLHMLADTLVSVGVVVSGIIIALTGWNIVDPIVSIIIAVVIFLSTWSLLSDSLRLLVDGTPEGIEIDSVEALLTANSHVSEVHHIHVWAMSTTDNALTAHVVIDSLEQMEAVKADLKHRLAEAGIGHSTLEFETAAAHCPDHECDCEHQ